jgi:hypothetical protein
MQTGYKRLKRLLRELGELQQDYLEYFHRHKWDETTLARKTEELERKREEIARARAEAMVFGDGKPEGGPEPEA